MVGFGQPETSDDFTLGQPRQVLLLLLVGAETKIENICDLNKLDKWLIQSNLEEGVDKSGKL